MDFFLDVLFPLMMLIGVMLVACSAIGSNISDD